MIEEVQVDEIVEIVDSFFYKNRFPFGGVVEYFQYLEGRPIFFIRQLTKRGTKGSIVDCLWFNREHFRQIFILREETGKYRKRFYPQDFTPEKRGGEPLKWL